MDVLTTILADAINLAATASATGLTYFAMRILRRPPKRARRGQLPAHTGVWTPGAAGLRAVCPPLPDTDAAPVDNRKRLTHRRLALPG
jgi:hypothetical protein